MPECLYEHTYIVGTLYWTSDQHQWITDVIFNKMQMDASVLGSLVCYENHFPPAKENT